MAEPSSPAAPTEGELALRRKLGIPDDARRVLVLQESSHWDTNWLRTSEEYFEERIRPIFEAVFQELAREPQRVFAIESIFFLKLYWERHPERRDELRVLLASRRLRLIGASLTTPDTLLAHPESVLRDYLLGQEWLRSIGSTEFPRVAYFPDNFGHSPALPSLMRAAGVDGVAVTRIDGMHFVGSDWSLPGTYPLPGSTAHQLQRELRTLDFVWRDAAGAEVLCHWNAFTYFQGDMLGHVGAVRWSGKLFGFKWRTRAHVARQLEGFVRALAPLSRTPYLLCPIGCDFNPPIEGLHGLVERYNAERSAKSGTHVVIAGLDDYLALVNFHRAALPVLEVDPNPAWMGFYASRPELKTRHARAARRLLHEDSLAAQTGVQRNEVAKAWELLALSNHHDFITGTSPDRVVDEEQVPWLMQAEALLGPAARTTAAAGEGPRTWRRRGEVHVETSHFELTFSEDRGGCLTSVKDVRGKELLSGVALDLVAYRDTGGLWRLGHEYAGGSFRRTHRTSDRHAEVTVHPEPGGVRLESVCWLGSERFRRIVRCRSGEPTLHVSVEGLPIPRCTVTCVVESAELFRTLRMDAAGGSVERPLEKLFSPTFWPALSTVEAGQLSLGLDAPTGVSASESGTLEWIVARHATKERAFGFLPILAHPIGGTVRGPQRHEATLAFAPTQPAAHPFIHCANERVRVGAVKVAANGRGIIVRLHAEATSDEPLRVQLSGAHLAHATLCDARESDLETLHVEAGAARVPLRERIAIVRLMRASAEPNQA